MRIVATFVVMFALVGCQQGAAQQTMARSEVYFGLSRPDGAVVSEAEFDAFVDREIVPRFPGGFSVLPAKGRWREASGRAVGEDSRVLILYSRSRLDLAAIEAVCQLYCDQFGQEAVLSAIDRAQVKFIGPSTKATERQPIVLEAEAGQMFGTMLATTRPGYSGAGYITGFDDGDDRVAWTFTHDTPGVYDVIVRYRAEHPKGFELEINGIVRSGFFNVTGEPFADHAAGKARLVAGENTLVLRRGWGYFDIDRIELRPAAISPVPPVRPTLVTPHADAATRALMERLCEDYGKTTWSGVYNTVDAESTLRRTGRLPVVFGGDLMDYSPSRVERGAQPAEPVETLLERARQGYTLTLCWHWNAPANLVDGPVVDARNGQTIDGAWYRGFMTYATTFDVAAALADPNGADYALLLRDIDAIAAQLKRFEAAGVPILWRPLHEADGRWFWWGAKGPEAFKALWHVLYERLVTHHKLRNLIWVYTGTADFDWYPPEGEFDIIGIDTYPSDVRDPQSALWEAIQSRYAGRKLIALAEFGGVPDVPAMHALGVRFSYFNSWVGHLGPDKMSDAALRAIYASPAVRSTGR